MQLVQVTSPLLDVLFIPSTYIRPQSVAGFLLSVNCQTLVLCITVSFAFLISYFSFAFISLRIRITPSAHIRSVLSFVSFRLFMRLRLCASLRWAFWYSVNFASSYHTTERIQYSALWAAICQHFDSQFCELSGSFELIFQMARSTIKCEWSNIMSLFVTPLSLWLFSHFSPLINTPFTANFLNIKCMLPKWVI